MANVTAATVDQSNFFYSSVLALAAKIDALTSPTLSPIGAQAYAHMAPIYETVNGLAGAVDQDPSVVMFMLCLIVSYPLGLVHRFVPTRFLRHLYSIVIGLFFCFFVFKWAALHAVVAALVPYLFILVLPGKFAVPLTWVWSFGYLALVHLNRMATDYLGWSLDFSCVMMLVCLKTIGAAYNVYDGKKDPAKVSGFHKEKLVNKVPNPLEYFGFMFYYPTVMSGPVIELKDYLDFVDGNGAPFSISAITQRFAMAVFCMVMYMLGGGFSRANLVRVVEPFAAVKAATAGSNGVISHIINHFISIVEAFKLAAANPKVVGPFFSDLLSRFAIVHVTSFFMRMKYYVGWYLAEGACVTAGFGYSGRNEDNEAMWEKIDQADLIGFEFSTNLKGIATNWNKAVSKWLRNYVFTRVNPDPKITGKQVRGGDRLKATALTFLVSALWHGFYPGYFFFWTALAVSDQIGTMLHDKLRPRLLAKHTWKRDQYINFYRVCGFIMSQSALSYFASSFHMLSWEDAITCFNSMYWIGHYIVFGMFVFMLVFPSSKAKKPETTTAATPAPETKKTK